MSDDDKLPLLRRALRELVLRLQPGDSVAIVTYAGTSGLALPATSGEDKQTILDAIDALRPGGSTNGASGIRLAYQIAREHFRKDGANRVLLCTDGDFNVGATSLSDLTTLIEKERATGVFLSVLGLGQGNLKDSTMETLADKGNGNYAYIDSLNEGRKVLVDQMSATLFTIAKDVKIQVEFNPATVAAYRLIGYENRLLAKEDFNDDKKDAGEIGAGHTVTALYEIIPPGQPVPGPSVDPLKYQPVPSIIENPDATLPQVQAEISRLLAGGLSSDHPLIKELLAKRQILESQAPANQLGSHITPANPNTAENPNTSDLLTVKLRYKQPDGDKSQLIQQVLKTGEGVPFDRAPSDFQFATAIAAFGLKLRGSESVDTMTWQDIQSIAKRNLGEDPGASRAEALTLIERASKLDR